MSMNVKLCCSTTSGSVTGSCLIQNWFSDCC